MNDEIEVHEDTSVISPSVPSSQSASLERQETVPLVKHVENDSPCLHCWQSLDQSSGEENQVSCQECTGSFHAHCLKQPTCEVCTVLEESPPLYGGWFICGSERIRSRLDRRVLSNSIQSSKERKDRSLRNLIALVSAKLESPGFNLGESASVGWDGDREENQDVGFHSEHESMIQLLCVFDGHGVGGRLAAREAAETLVCQSALARLNCENVFNEDFVRQSMEEAFRFTQNSLLQQLNAQGLECGTTAVVAQLISSKLLVANVGDSRAILIRDSESHLLSRDHSFSRADECARIRATSQGDIVIGAGNMLRIVPGIKIS